jgi:hypothetical protein
MIDKVRPKSSLSSEPPAIHTRPGMPRRTKVVLILLAAAIISGIAGLLSRAAGNNIPSAVLTGGAAFAGAVGLLLAIAHYTAEGSST